MFHVNLLRWCNLIVSLSRDIGQYPMIEISWDVITVIKTNKPLIKTNEKCYLVYFWSVHV